MNPDNSLPMPPEPQPEPFVSPPAQDYPSQPQGAPQPPTGGQPSHFLINQQFKFGKETFSVTDGQNLVCLAKAKLFTVKEHIDVYRDAEATMLNFTIEQKKAIAISKVYDVVSVDGTKMGGFKLEAMHSVMKEHWDILDAGDNPIGVIDQNATTAMEGKFGVMGAIIPQTFIASMNGQQVCLYREEMNIGMFFKMDIDFSGDTGGMFDRTLGLAAAILLSAKHMQTR